MPHGLIELTMVSGGHRVHVTLAGST